MDLRCSDTVRESGSTDEVPAGVTEARRLVERCLGGDEGAWHQLVDGYARLVHSVALRHGLVQAEVEDVGQDVFMALAQNLHRVDDPDRLAGWLVTTTRRLCWRRVQQRRLESPFAEANLAESDAVEIVPLATTPMPSMAQLLEGWHRQESLAQGFSLLAERCRDLVSAIFLDPDEPSYDEISRRLGIPKGSIGPTRNRCLEQLRSILEGLGFSSRE